MKILFTINGVLETLAGIVFLFAATKIPGMENAADATIYLAGMYGAAALSVGILSFLVTRSMDNAGLINAFLIFGIVFHACVALVCALNMGMAFDTTGAAVFHGFMAIAFLYFKLKK